MAYENLEWDDSLALMSVPDLGPMSRRQFLTASAAGVALAAMPSFMSDWAAAATPVGPTDGILVVL
jgi:hypothetical protein